MDIYEQLSNKETNIEIKRRTDLRNIYNAFFSDFRSYLVEFVKESLVETVFTEMPVSTVPLSLFKEETGRHIILKNQGQIECWVNTCGQGGYRLDPGEKTEKIWVNKPVSLMTVSGNTTVGLIQC
jgi:hypothetical protein